ncbi:MAG: flavodoxin family protein [Candidatus Omnitrophota bacterium]|nr:MAG: flavodoxin family protein [Candidatus Omnitrophota bacterium]
MAKVLIIYYSAGGNTKKMAQAVAEGVKKEGLDATLKSVEAVKAKEMLEFQAIIIGSPTYYGSMVAPLKKLLDESVDFHGELDGKIGAAFTSSANIGGGNETTILDILNAMLIHGMIIQGDPQGDHYGPVAINSPDNRTNRECARLGSRVAKLVKKLYK